MTGKPNTLNHLDRVQTFAAEYTDKDGNRHHAVFGFFPNRQQVRWFVLPGTQDSLTQVPAQWLTELLEEARSAMDGEPVPPIVEAARK